MPRKPRLRQCSRCGKVHPGGTKQCDRCGTWMVPKRFRMTKARLRLVHALARQKGLDDETYRLRLQAYGVESSKAMKKRVFDQFVKDLKQLPDAA